MSFQILVFSLLALSTNVLGKSTRIIGGKEASISDFPFMAGIINNLNGLLECGGAILTHRDILTASHCLYMHTNPVRSLKIAIGSSNAKSSDAIVLKIFRVFLHPSFKVHESETITYYENDVAIIKTEEFIEYSRTVNKIDLPTADIQSRSVATIAGWGLISYPELVFPATLKKTWMKVYDKEFCESGYPIPLTEDQFCAFQRPGVGPCMGDSGGSLVQDNKVLGIASACVPCAVGFPDMYTNIFRHVTFIRSYLSE